ncbi:MAG: hypothetical protein LBO63_07155, partial [Oscillospiraceae bacterium]|nr:hypothetical protein [Oscillospiraceae bacterium]
ATSLEEAIFFYTGTAVVTIRIMPFPATYCGGVRERFRCATRRGEACRGVGGLGKSPTCRELPTGANQDLAKHARTAPALCCAASR